MSMTIELPNDPVDGFTVEYWRIDCDRLEHYRAVYYKNTEWKDHPWSLGDGLSNRGGAPFIDEWALSRGTIDNDMNEWFHGVGRIPRWANINLGEGIYTSELPALEELHRRLESRLKRAKEEMAEYELRVTETRGRIEALKHQTSNS